MTMNLTNLGNSRVPLGHFAAAAIMTVALASCAGMPRSVASLSEVEEASKQGAITLIPVTAATLPTPSADTVGFPRELIAGDEYAYERLGPGDRLTVRIWESGSATVFAGTGGSNLGEMTIDEAGKLYLPYVGAVRAAGLTVSEIRESIIRRLRTVVLRPQVDVQIVERRSTLVTVQGDAAKTGNYPIERGRTRLSSLLAEVAPNQKNPETLNVAVRRNGLVGQVRLSDMYKDSALDIALRPGDSIILNEVVENITVLGAAGVQGQVRIPDRNFTVIDALGEARGLNPEAADPRGLFVLRSPAQAGAAPLVYQFDMRRPDAIALARQFILRDEDAVLISNASWVRTRQVISAFSQGMASVRSAATIPVQ
jgi:polysaccharide export outer membrane protein